MKELLETMTRLYTRATILASKYERVMSDVPDGRDVVIIMKDDDLAAEYKPKYPVAVVVRMTNADAKFGPTAKRHRMYLGRCLAALQRSDLTDITDETLAMV